jgi:hypothetical protein
LSRARFLPLCETFALGFFFFPRSFATPRPSWSLDTARAAIEAEDLASPPARPWAGEQGAARIGRMYADALRF